MADAEFQIGEHVYRAARLDVFSQYDLARKWAPVLLWVSQGKQGAYTSQEFARAFAAVTAQVPKDDSDFCIQTCLGSVSRRIDGGVGWARLRGASGNMAFADFDLTEMLQIVYHVLQTNGLIDFFFDPAATSGAAGPE